MSRKTIMAAIAACALPFITACESFYPEDTVIRQGKEMKSIINRSSIFNKGALVPLKVNPDTLPPKLMPAMMDERQALRDNLSALDGQPIWIKSVYRDRYIYSYSDGEEVGFNVDTNMCYIYDSKLRYAFAYYDDPFIPDCYGISEWIETLPEKKISLISLSQNYKVIGL